MAWTAPRTWLAGEKPTAATFNLEVRDNLLFLKDSLGGAHINYKQLTVNTPLTGAITKITNLTPVDVGADITHAAGDFTVAKAGVYVCSVSLAFVANATGTRNVYIYVNGVGVGLTTSAGTTSVYLALSKTFRLAANDVVAMYGFQNSGAGLNTIADYNTAITLTRIGA